VTGVFPPLRKRPCATRGKVIVMLRHAALMMAAFAVGVLPAMGQEKADDAKAAAAAKDAPKPVPLTATVVSVTGIAEKRLASQPNSKWEPLKAGDVLGELALVRTGLGAKVILRFSDRGDVTVKGATKIGIGTFRKRGRLVRTHLGLKYGSMYARVHRERGPNDFRVATPVATLSVQGSQAYVGSWGYALGVNGVIGLWYVDAQGETHIVQAGESTDQDLTQWDEITQYDGDIKLVQYFGDMSPLELWNLLNNGGGRGLFGAFGNPITGRLFGGVFVPLPGGDSSDTHSPNGNGELNGYENGY